MKGIRSFLMAIGLWILCANVAAAQGIGFGSSEFSTGRMPLAVAIADFDGNGKLDLAVANSSDNTVSILLGVGDGTFHVKTDFPTGNNPVGIIVTDFDGDGKLDLASVNWVDSKVSILLGNGDGTFRPHTDFATGNNPSGIAVGDFDGDGKLDLVTVNPVSDNISILLGLGGGAFGPNVNYPTGAGPSAVVVGDFNGDTKLDVAAANSTAGTVSILLGNGNGTFGPKTDFSAANGASALALGDFDGNGKLDLATSSYSAQAVSILLGNGDGTFTRGTDLATNHDPITVAAADFDTNSKADLLAVNEHEDCESFDSFDKGFCIPTDEYSYSFSIWLGNGDGTFANRVDFDLAWNIYPSGTATGDLNADGRVDVAIAKRDSNSVLVLLQSAVLSPSPSSLNLDNQALGTSRTPQTATLTSTGSFSAVVSSIALEGANSTEFRVTEDTCSGNTIPSGSDCAMSVAFSPTSAGYKYASVVIPHSGANSPLTINLSGLGLSPDPFPVFSPSSLDFGAQLVKSAQSLWGHMTNFGVATLRITSITVTGPNNGDFTLDDEYCDASLNSAATCYFAVTFQPISVGPESAAVSVVSNAPGSPHLVQLTGTGTAAPVVTLSPTSLTFAAELVNTSSTAQNLTLTKSGSATLNIAGITMTGTNTSDFSQTNTCGTSVAASASCTISVTFKPTATGSRTAWLSVSSNASGSPHTVALSGEGSDFSIGPTNPPPLAVNKGQTANFTFNLGGDGFSGSVALSCATSSPELSCAVPASVNVTSGTTSNVTGSVTTTMQAFAPLGGQPRILSASAAKPALLAGLLSLLLLAAMCLIQMSGGGRMRFRLRTAGALAGLLLCAVVWSGCNAASSSPPPAARTYQLTVNASSSGAVHTFKFQVMVP